MFSDVHSKREHCYCQLFLIVFLIIIFFLNTAPLSLSHPLLSVEVYIYLCKASIRR